jgi:hypothetical protein
MTTRSRIEEAFRLRDEREKKKKKVNHVATFSKGCFVKFAVGSVKPLDMKHGRLHELPKTEAETQIVLTSFKFCSNCDDDWCIGCYFPQDYCEIEIPDIKGL